MKEIERLQECLLLLRRAVGWTAEDLGQRIGVTRQTINNLETKRSKLNKTQYIAIRAVLDAEIVQSPDETEMLKYLLEVFVDHPEKYNEKQRKELWEKANMLTPAILAGTTSRRAVSMEIATIAGGLGLAAAVLGGPIIGVGAAVAASSSWIMKTLSDKKK